jgi:glycosyltransferase involved in cell wall biosynthesis
MNILIVCDYFLDYLGGAQTALAAEVAALREAGHRVTIVAPRRTHDPLTNENESFFSPIVLPVLDLAIVTNSGKTRARLADLLVRLSIDVVHVHSEFGLAAAAIRVAAEADVPSFHTVHTFYWRSGLPSSRLLAWLIRNLHHCVTGLPAPMVRLSDNHVDNAVRGMTLAVARRARTVVSPSAHQAVDLRAAEVPVVATVANCVTPGTGALAREVREVYGPLRVLWIGRCIPEKRVVEFAEAAATACELVGTDHLQVTFVGAGPLAGHVRKIAARTPGVRMLGRVANDAVAAMMESHHVSALTSFAYDNQPMTVAESITALRGVIYVDPRLREGLDAAGIFVDDPSVTGMAATLVDLALDPRPVIAASQRAFEARQAFSSEEHAEALQRVYRRAPTLGVAPLSVAEPGVADLTLPA